VTTGDGDRDGPGDVHPDEREDRPELDIEAAFAAIIADFGAPLPEGQAPWPEAEEVRPDEPPAGEVPFVDPSDPSDPSDAFRQSRRGPRHRLPDGSSVPGAYDIDPAPDLDDPDEPEDPHDRFVPPEPPPITSTDLPSRLAWLGVIGGPLFLLVAALVWRALPTLVVIGALSAFIGGFVTLVARLPRDRGDGSDDGAVV
jgi:hypothetical protein